MLYEWPLREEFLNRADDLARMEEWYGSRDRNALALYGRRRVGKSWLLRRFAHGKRAILLVAERVAEGSQLTKFAAALEPALGVRPEIPNVPSLLRLLYRLGREQRTLAIVDEFPYLLPASEGSREATLTAIQAIMEEEREGSQTRLLLCGSLIAQMEGLFAAGSALRGRLTPLPVAPLSFAEAAPFIVERSPAARITRYAVTGGMARYLGDLGRGGSLRGLVCSAVLDRRGPLFNDPREVLEQELRQPAVYFSILEELSHRRRNLQELATALRVTKTTLPRYLENLHTMGLVERVVPVTAGPRAKGGHYRIGDGFLRFWFRFVFPYQEDLQAGLRPADLYDTEIDPNLADHVAPTFESICRAWTRASYGTLAQRVGPWWGNARNDLRRDGLRHTEEIDILGLGRGVVRIVGECKWTRRPMGVEILSDLDTYKLPALRQDAQRLAGEPLILLFSRSGYTRGLRDAARRDRHVRLVELQELVPGVR
jgi:AAA+ ATPase superfamily predicted ATPase